MAPFPWFRRETEAISPTPYDQIRLPPQYLPTMISPSFETRPSHSLHNLGPSAPTFGRKPR